MMTLTHFEKQVIEILLKDKISLEVLNNIISDGLITNYEYTGAGYYLELSITNLNLKNQTIHEPIISGRAEDIYVGFLLYIEENKIIIECHGWGADNPPENLREFNLDILIERK